MRRNRRKEKLSVKKIFKNKIKCNISIEAMSKIIFLKQGVRVSHVLAV